MGGRCARARSSVALRRRKRNKLVIKEIIIMIVIVIGVSRRLARTANSNASCRGDTSTLVGTFAQAAVAAAISTVARR